MKKENWRNKIDLVLEQNLNELIKETKQYDYAIKKADDRGKAQMWVALALINNKLNQVLLNDKKTGRKIPKDELKDILETLEKL